ncbi:MAG: 50S ribosomal protein L24 [Candidatus Marinimicrobia bacterium]|nr:50S ribosomal protein L24 [Candidatus Neomarinimicrobiota bacterium]
MKIKKNDQVIVLAGADKGKTGKVLAVFPKTRRVLVEGVNFIKKHQRQTSANAPSGIIEKEAAMHISNVALFQDGKAAKVGYKFLDDGRKVRFLKAGGEIIDR